MKSAIHQIWHPKVNCVINNSANLSCQSKLCRHFIKFVFCMKFLRRHVLKQVLLANKHFLLTKQIWFSKANLDRNSVYLLLASKLCQQFFCRCQQHDYSADISLFLLSRQRMEMILFRLACFFLSLQLTTYCQTFQVGSTFYVLPQYSSGTVFVT